MNEKFKPWKLTLEKKITRNLPLLEDNRNQFSRKIEGFTVSGGETRGYQDIILLAQSGVGKYQELIKEICEVIAKSQRNRMSYNVHCFSFGSESEQLGHKGQPINVKNRQTMLGVSKVICELADVIKPSEDFQLGTLFPRISMYAQRVHPTANDLVIIICEEEKGVTLSDEVENQIRKRHLTKNIIWVFFSADNPIIETHAERNRRIISNMTLKVDKPELQGITQEKEYVLRAYKDTLRRCDELILVVGREPNNAACEVLSEIGPYDWEAHPRCFWAVAQERAAQILGVEARTFKGKCAEKQCSPLVLVNAMPVPIPDRSGKQVDQRRKTTDREKHAHIEQILQIDVVMNKVQEVWFCGLDAPCYDIARKMLSDFFTARNVKVVDMPFLTRINSKKAQDVIASGKLVRTMNVLRKVFFDMNSGSERLEILPK